MMRRPSDMRQLLGSEIKTQCLRRDVRRKRYYRAAILRSRRLAFSPASPFTYYASDDFAAAISRYETRRLAFHALVDFAARRSIALFILCGRDAFGGISLRDSLAHLYEAPFIFRLDDDCTSTTIYTKINAHESCLARHS